MFNKSNISITNKIPKHIHQIWIGEKEQPNIYIDTWRNNYILQNQDWNYTLWNEKLIDQLFQDNIQDNLVNILYKLYNIEETMYGKSDIARYFILYYNGGIYIDADCVWINNKSLNPLLDGSRNTNFFAALEADKCPYIANSVIGSTIKHSNLLKLMNIIASYQYNYVELRKKYDAWEIIGPLLISKLDRSLLTLFPSVYFYPIHWNGIKDPHLHKKIKLPKESYMFQYGITTNNLDYTKPDNSIIENNFNNFINNHKQILFSCTTFLKDDINYKRLNRTLDTFLEYNKADLHLIDKFIIVMEYSLLNNKYINELKNKYYMMTFIIKTEDKKGQATSINMIIDNLSGYKYWLHWEESWYSIGPILKNTYLRMETSDINNLQLTKREVLYDMPIIENEYINCTILGNQYKVIKANTKLKELWRYWEINDLDFTVWKNVGFWPFYSLTPSMSKVNTIVKTGYHNQDIIKWPFQFEFEWALKWIRRNDIVVGIPININVTRDDNHNSSYNIENYNKWLKYLETKENKETYNRNVNYYTLKSDKLKLIIFWNPYCSSTILKQFIFYIEEGFPYIGDNIHKELGYYNYNKYFVEINNETLQKFNDYTKILVVRNPVDRVKSFLSKNNIDKTTLIDKLSEQLPHQTQFINIDWIDQYINVNNLSNYLKKYNYDFNKKKQNNLDYSLSENEINAINSLYSVDIRYIK
tara:strand:+ start:156 stop:2255 length:2100 start_codon:yes stop_codon:yes gene_type:complete